MGNYDRRLGFGKGATNQILGASAIQIDALPTCTGSDHTDHHLQLTSTELCGLIQHATSLHHQQSVFKHELGCRFDLQVRSCLSSLSLTASDPELSRARPVPHARN